VSKVGRRPISLASVTATIEGKDISFKGPKGEVTHKLAENVQAEQRDGFLYVTCSNKATKKGKMLWGLHRALLANKIKGVQAGFETPIKIVGLGYKAQLAGKKLIFTLGFSHKVEYALPEGVTVDIDKTGQKLLFKSTDRFLLGSACDAVRSLKPPEPYKGTGIMRESERIVRKAGKTKAS